MVRKVVVFGKSCEISETDITSVDAYGLFHPDTFKIQIQKDLSSDLKEIVELHELGHALLTRLGLVDVIDGNLQEIIVEGYANFLHETFLMKYKDGTGS